MGASCNCCWCWKTKPTERAPADPFVNPCTSSSQDPPSTDSPNQLQIVISSTHPSSTTPNPPSTSKKPPPTLQEVKSNFQKIDIESQGDGFIKAIEEFLKTAQKRTTDTPSTSSSHTDKLSNWAPIIQSGGKFLKFVNDHTEKIKINTKDSSFQSGEATKIVGNILEHIGQVHWAVAGLSMVGYLVSKCAKASENRNECVELLQQMIKFVPHIKKLDTLIKGEKEKFEKAFQYIIEGSISCASQLHSGKFFSFLKSTVNSETLTEIRNKIRDLYMDLNLTATTEVLEVTKEISRQTTIRKEILPQVFPNDAEPCIFVNW